jgi:hypothetical protein
VQAPRLGQIGQCMVGKVGFEGIKNKKMEKEKQFDG